MQIADIAGMCGMTFFLIATLKQWHKIYKTHNTSGISTMHYKLKLVAIICSLICFSLTGLWLSFSVVGAELVVSIAITRMLIKYRKKKDYREMTDKEFIKEIKKW